MSGLKAYECEVSGRTTGIKNNSLVIHVLACTMLLNCIIDNDKINRL